MFNQFTRINSILIRVISSFPKHLLLHHLKLLLLGLRDSARILPCLELVFLDLLELLLHEDGPERLLILFLLDIVVFVRGFVVYWIAFLLRCIVGIAATS